MATELCEHRLTFYGDDGLRCQLCGAHLPTERGERRFWEDDSREIGPANIGDAQPMTDGHLMPGYMRRLPRR